MANNPIDTNSFRHYLNFKSLGFNELYEITEPVGFDVANFVIKQNSERFGRDIVYGNDQANETYYHGQFEKSIEQVQDQNGSISSYLDMGLNWILETYKRFGFEGEIERILTKDGINFTIGLLDMSNPDTDGFSYFGCNVVQNTKIANYKRQLDTSIDVFATKNIKDEPITPAPTLKVLRRAVPITKNSEWGKTSLPNLHNFASAHYFSLNNNILTSNIQNTLSSVAEVARYNSSFGNDGWRYYTQSQLEAGGYDYTDGTNGGSMRLIKSTRKLTDIKVRVKFKGKITQRQNSFTPMSFTYLVMANYGDFKAGLDSGDYSKVFDIPLTKDVEVIVDVDTVLSFPKNLNINEYLYGCYTALNPSNLYFSAACNIIIEESIVQVVGSELSLDTVINGVRYIDMIKQCSKFINNLPIDASMFDIEGEHYNNICYNRALLSMQTNNSIVLITPTNPAGNVIGDVVNNTIDNGTMAVGLYFWNSSIWVNLSTGIINEVLLTSINTPAGTFEGELIFNISKTVGKNGLCFWNSTFWQSLEYTRPFTTTTKDCFENAMTLETCGDYEIQNNKIYFGKYADFYTNNEIAIFNNLPSKDLKENWNDRFKINNFKFSYDTFEQNRLSENTSEDLHTETEWSIPNNYVENKLERSVKYIRSGYSAQVMVDLETTKPLTAYENDDKVFINSIAALPPGTAGGFQATLFMQIIEARLQILNTDSDGNKEAAVINWISLGLSIGDTLIIESGSNAGNYVVYSLTNSTIVLTPVGFTPSFTGNDTIKLKYFYTNILWQTETNERVTVISGLNNPLQYPNLFYTLRRNMVNWEGYLNSACLFHQDKKVRNLFFRNNPKVLTQIGSGPIYEDKYKTEILVSSLTDPILSAKIIDLEVSASYSEVLNLLNSYYNDRGFIRGLNIDGRIIKGYIQELDYTWKSGRLKLKLEEKYEADTIILTYSDGILKVNDTIYNLNGNVNWWKVTGNYFQFFDSNNHPICNTRHYSEVSLNGVIYTNADNLINALLIL